MTTDPDDSERAVVERMVREDISLLSAYIESPESIRDLVIFELITFWSAEVTSQNDDDEILRRYADHIKDDPEQAIFANFIYALLALPKKQPS